MSPTTHPEHTERLDWLGLTDAREFTPTTFDLAAVNRGLATLR